MPKKDLEYRGTPELDRKRLLREEPFLEHNQDKTLKKDRTRVESTTDLFQDLAAVYLKGEVLKRHLGEMNPLGFIPIEEHADKVSAAAVRFDDHQSLHGKQITYGMWQKAIDSIVNSNWEVRRLYLNIKVPIGFEAQNLALDKAEQPEEDDDWLSQFLNGLGIAGLILAFFGESIFDWSIWSTLSSEEGAAKAVALARIPPGVAFLIELGLKAWQIIQMFKQLNPDMPDIESIVEEMEDPANRRKAFESVGIDYDSFVANQTVPDSRVLIEYVSDYFARYLSLIHI